MRLDFRILLFILISVLSFFYCLLYILRDLYYATGNFQMKKYINRLLPFFTKYNIYFLLLTLISLIVFSLNNFSFLIFLTIFIVLINFLFIFLSPKKFTSTSHLRLSSYILIISIALLPIS